MKPQRRASVSGLSSSSISKENDAGTSPIQVFCERRPPKPYPFSLPPITENVLGEAQAWFDSFCVGPTPEDESRNESNNLDPNDSPATYGDEEHERKTEREDLTKTQREDSTTSTFDEAKEDTAASIEESGETVHCQKFHDEVRAEKLGSAISFSISGLDDISLSPSKASETGLDDDASTTLLESVGNAEERRLDHVAVPKSTSSTTETNEEEVRTALASFFDSPSIVADILVYLGEWYADQSMDKSLSMYENAAFHMSRTLQRPREGKAASLVSPDVHGRVGKRNHRKLSQGDIDMALRLFCQALCVKMAIQGATNHDNQEGTGDLLQEVRHLIRKFRKKCVRAIEQNGADDSRLWKAVLTALEEFANLYAEAGVFRYSAKLLAEVVKFKQMILGKGHDEVAGSYLTYAVFLESAGEGERAVKAAQEAYATYLKLEGEDGLDTLKALDELGRLYQSLGEGDKAVKAGVMAVDVRKRCYGKDHPDVADSLLSLGVYLDETGRSKRALRCMKRAMTIYTDIHRGRAASLQLGGDDAVGASVRSPDDDGSESTPKQSNATGTSSDPNAEQPGKEEEERTNPTMKMRWLPNSDWLRRATSVQSVKHVELVVSDVSRSTTFYMDALGLKKKNLRTCEGNGERLAGGNIEIHLTEGEPLAHERDDDIVAQIEFGVSNKKDVFDKLREMGVPLENRARKGGGSGEEKLSQTVIRDPDGYCLEIGDFILDHRQEQGRMDSIRAVAPFSKISSRVKQLVSGRKHSKEVKPLPKEETPPEENTDIAGGDTMMISVPQKEM